MQTLLLSFVSPSGRLDPVAFWWRCLLLALGLYPCAYALNYYDTIAHCGVGGSGIGDLLIFAQLSLPALISTLLAYFGGYEAGVSAVQLNVEGSALCGGYELPIALLMSLLLAWCQAVIVIKRVRDTRWGIPLLLACLPCFGPVSIIVCCLPSRSTPLPPLSERKFRRLTAADVSSASRIPRQ